MTNMSDRKLIAVANNEFALTMVVKLHGEVAKFNSKMVSGSTIKIPRLIRDHFRGWQLMLKPDCFKEFWL